MSRTQWPMQWHNNVWAILSCSSCCTKVHFPQVIKKLPLNLLVSVGQGHILPMDGCVDGIWWRGKWWLHPPHIPPRPSSCRHSSPRSSLTFLSGAESDPGRRTWSEDWLSSWMLNILRPCLIRAGPTSSRTAVSLVSMSSTGFLSPQDNSPMYSHIWVDGIFRQEIINFPPKSLILPF